MAERTCRICGAPVPRTNASDLTAHRYRCCSQECVRTFWRLRSQERNGTATKTDKPCAECGQPTGVNPGRGRDRKFCSPGCSSAAANRARTKSYRPATETPIVILDCVECGDAHVTRPWIKRQRCHPCHEIHLRHKKRSSGARYRARKRNACTEVFANVDVYERDGWRCGLCGQRINRKLVFPHPRSVSLDHIIPLSRGGEHSMANTQASHYECNLRKNNGILAPEQLRLIG